MIQTRKLLSRVRLLQAEILDCIRSIMTSQMAVSATPEERLCIDVSVSALHRVLGFQLDRFRPRSWCRTWTWPKVSRRRPQLDSADSVSIRCAASQVRIYSSLCPGCSDNRLAFRSTRLHRRSGSPVAPSSGEALRQYALSGSVEHHSDEDNIVRCLPLVFSQDCCRSAV